MGFRLDDASFIQVEYIYLPTTEMIFTFSCIYSHVESGSHQVSFYWVHEHATRTITLAYLFILGIIITV